MIQLSTNGCIETVYYIEPNFKTEWKSLHRQWSVVRTTPRVSPTYEVMKLQIILSSYSGFHLQDTGLLKHIYVHKTRYLNIT